MKRNAESTAIDRSPYSELATDQPRLDESHETHERKTEGRCCDEERYPQITRISQIRNSNLCNRRNLWMIVVAQTTEHRWRLERSSLGS